MPSSEVEKKGLQAHGDRGCPIIDSQIQSLSCNLLPFHLLYHLLYHRLYHLLCHQVPCHPTWNLLPSTTSSITIYSAKYSNMLYHTLSSTLPFILSSTTLLLTLPFTVGHFISYNYYLSFLPYLDISGHQSRALHLLGVLHCSLEVRGPTQRRTIPFPHTRD